jgi:hypothetical protein
MRGSKIRSTAGSWRFELLSIRKMQRHKAPIRGDANHHQQQLLLLAMIVAAT